MEGKGREGKGECRLATPPSPGGDRCLARRVSVAAAARELSHVVVSLYPSHTAVVSTARSALVRARANKQHSRRSLLSLDV